jgi:hypothetical protein
VLAVLACALATSIALGAEASAAGRRHPRVIASLPAHAEVGHVVRISGRVSGAPGASSVVLERRHGRHWRVLAAARVRHRRFTLSWRATPVGSATLRLVARRHRVALASSPARRLSVLKAPAPLPGSGQGSGQGSTPSQPGSAGPSAGAPGGGAPTPPASTTHACSPAGPPTGVPAGDGWITGGAYFGAGAGSHSLAICLDSYTVNVLNEAGATVASSHVTEHGSFTFVLPPGRYKLSGVCRPQSVTVRAGQETSANIICALL